MFIEILFYILSIIVVISLLIPIAKKYIDYTMDFLVITPDYMIKYDQKWFFQRDILTINNKSSKQFLSKNEIS